MKGLVSLYSKGREQRKFSERCIRRVATFVKRHLI
jgi:hypothetical protein